MRWFLFRLQESPRYLVSRGRQQDALVALKAIATYNDHSMELSPADIHAEYDADAGAELDSNSKPEVPERDKKNSELPSPAGETSPIPLSSEMIRPTSATSYNSVGIGPAPPVRHTPIRQGSAFYTQSPGRTLDEPDINTFEASFASMRRRSSEEEERLIGQASDRLLFDKDQDQDQDERDDEASLGGGKKSRRSSWTGLDLRSWWNSWVMQISKLFVPQWRRTVILMWIIWGSMSFGECEVGRCIWAPVSR
jgi:hypothetical protein